MKRWKTLCKLSLFALGFWAALRFADKRTDGFTAASIDTNIPAEEAFGIEPLCPEKEEEIKRLLSQPFFYLSRGGQSYVFISQDKKVVLKFFKKNHALPDTLVSWIDRIVPEKLRRYRLQLLQTRHERFRSIFSSCRLAYEKLREDTGMLYLHLNPTKDKYKPLTIVDRMGIRHQIDLDKTSFVLQKRARLMLRTIKRQMSCKDLEGAKQSIRSMMLHLVRRSKQGIRDTDNALKRNYGDIGDKPVCIDVGSFILDPSLSEPKACQKELFRKTRRLRKWLRYHYPELFPYYQEVLTELS